jgi:hypothetical protein
LRHMVGADASFSGGASFSASVNTSIGKVITDNRI